MFSMVEREGKVIQKVNFPTPRHVTVTEDSVKFQDMFDQAIHHAPAMVGLAGPVERPGRLVLLEEAGVVLERRHAVVGAPRVTL